MRDTTGMGRGLPAVCLDAVKHSEKLIILVTSLSLLPGIIGYRKEHPSKRNAKTAT